MPLPTASQVHVNAPLTNVSLAYVQSATDYIAADVFPQITVTKQSDLYYKYDKGDFFRLETAKRAPSTETRGAGYRLSTETYFCDVWGLHRDIDDQVRANQDSVIDMDRDATIYLTQQILMRKDTEWVSRFFTSGVWETEKSDDWTSAAANPWLVLRSVITSVQERTGMRPNTAVFGHRAWNKFVDTSKVLERVQFTERAIVGTDLVLATLGLQRVKIASSVSNRAPEGAPDEIRFIDDVLGPNRSGVWIGYVNPSPGVMQPSAGYMFSWSGLLGANAAGMRVKTFRQEQLSSDRVEVECAFDMKVTGPDLGAFVSVLVA